MSQAANDQTTDAGWITHSPEETFAIATQLGARLRGGEVLLLDGELGAGKTVFVKGLAAALGFDVDEVTSPSFTLVNRYDARLTLYHLDLYRLPDGVGAAHSVDLEELLTDERAVIAIEWGERLGAYPLPAQKTWRINLTGDGDDPRLITLRNE